MSKFEDFFSSVLSDAKNLAVGELKNFGGAIKNDAEAFLNATKANLQKWTEQLATNKLSKEEFEDLVAGQSDLAKMFALTEAGIGAARLQRLRDALIKLVIDRAFKTFLP